MGQYFIVVNPVKREYVDPSDFGVNNKVSGLMQGLPALAVGLLICDGLPDPGPTGLIGSWVGDPVIAAGDDYGRPNAGGVQTATAENPERNLYQAAKAEYANITLRAIAMLAHRGWSGELAALALEPFHPGALISVGRVVFEQGCEPLRAELEKLDPQWKVRYKHALQQR
jgi:hypothetical protein